MNITNLKYVIPSTDIDKIHQELVQISTSLVDISTVLSKINVGTNEIPTINKEFKAGTRFQYRGLEWIALDEVDGGVLAIVNKLIGKHAFDKENGNDWSTSTLRYYLSHDFLKNFNTNDLIVQSLDLTSDDGMKNYGVCADYIGLLSCDQYRKYRDILPKYDDWWWTITPWTCNMSSANFVRIVNTSGAVNYDHASVASGVPPTCIFKI